jgi:hypothetical protein
MLHELAFALTLTKERLISYRPTMYKHRKFNNAVSSYRLQATDPEARVRFPALPRKKKVVGLERGSLSLVSTTEEILDRKVAAPV